MSRPAVPVKSHIVFRPTWSCTECARRKVRCDKQIPCGPCLKRGCQDRCSRGNGVDESAVTRSSAEEEERIEGYGALQWQDSHAQLTAVVAQLLRRVDQLERQQQQQSALKRAPVAGSPTNNGVSNAHSSPAQPPTAYTPSHASTALTPSHHTSTHLTLAIPAAEEEVEHEDTSVTIEYLALGKNRRLGILGGSRDPHTATAPTTNLLETPHDLAFPPPIAAVLLPHRSLRYLLTFHADAVQWQHACIHTQTFESQAQVYLDMENNLQRWHRIDTLWLALLLSIQTITLHQMPAEDIASLFPGQQRDDMVENTLTAVRACLDAGDFMRRPNFFACQAIAILTVCGHNCVDSNLLSSLLAVGIKTAQMLNLHVLGAESERVRARLMDDGMGSDESLKRRVISLELGKRVWWSLTQQDYFAIPFRGVSLVHPNQHDTPLPSNVVDADLDRGLWRVLDDSELSLTLKQRITSASADVLCRFFANLPRSGANLADHVTPFESSLVGLLPPRPTRSSDPRLTFGAALARYLNISVRHKMLVIHRAFCGRSPANKRELQRSQRVAVDLARSIFSHCHMGATSTRPGNALLAAMWTTAYHAVAAATVLAMDMLAQRESNTPAAANREEVEEARAVLQSLAGRSPIAARGVALLTSLLQQHDEASLPPPPSTSRRQSRSEENDIMQPLTKRARLSTTAAEEESRGVGGDLAEDWDHLQAMVSMLEHVPDMGSLFDGSLGDPFAST